MLEMDRSRADKKEKEIITFDFFPIYYSDSHIEENSNSDFNAEAISLFYDASKKLHFKLVVKEKLHKNSEWLQSYLFHYENLDKEKLIKIFY